MLYVGKSDTGKKRATNQDCFAAIKLGEDILLSVVCDGMGGAAGGNIAAETASEVFTGYISRNVSRIGGDTDVKKNIYALLTEAASEANSAVYNLARGNSDLAGMGTTLISALIYGGMMYVANVGDSRLYIITDSEIKKITRDHSFVQYLVDMGQLTPDEAAKSPHRNIITRAIGSDSTVETDIYSLSLAAGDIRYILLCSDGLTNYVTVGEIFGVLMSGPPEKDNAALEAKTTSLIDMANKAGGGDNITALVIKVDF